MPGQLYIEEHKIPFDKIKEGIFDKDKFSDYAISILDFCLEYLNNQPEFSVNTSGSTGLSKKLRLKRKQLQASALMTCKYLNLDRSIEALLCINAAYIGGLMMLVRAMEFNWNMTVVNPKSNPYHPKLPNFQFMALVPVQLAEIAANSEATAWAQATSKIIVGGAPVATELETRVSYWPKPVYLTFGMTETVSHIALKCITGGSPSKYFTILDGVKIKIDDRGCLVLKSKVTNDEWLTTNDLVELIDEKHFQWLGRVDNIINSGGHKVIPEVVEKEIRTVLIDQGINNDFFVVGLADPKLGQKVTLLIEGKPKGIQEILRDYLKDRLHPYEIPRSVRYVEQFSRTKNQKIQRKRTIGRM